MKNLFIYFFKSILIVTGIAGKIINKFVQILTLYSHSVHLKEATAFLTNWVTPDALKLITVFFQTFIIPGAYGKKSFLWQFVVHI